MPPKLNTPGKTNSLLFATYMTVRAFLRSEHEVELHGVAIDLHVRDASEEEDWGTFMREQQIRDLAEEVHEQEILATLDEKGEAEIKKFRGWRELLLKVVRAMEGKRWAKEFGDEKAFDRLDNEEKRLRAKVKAANIRL